MKNILNEKPDQNLHGRLLFSADFVDDEDIKNKTILDIGCGYGWCEMNFLKRGVKEIIGMETSEDDLKTAKQYIEDKRAGFIVGNALKIPFKNDCFDTVVCWEVLEHIPKNNEMNLFREVNRVLKKDGAFYLSTPYDRLLSIFFDPAWWLIGHRHYGKKQITQYIQKNGFKLVKMEVRGKIWCLISGINMYFSKWILRRKPLFQKYFIKKENLEYQKKNGFNNIFIKAKK